MTDSRDVGDSGSFEAQVLPHLDALYRFAHRLTGDSTEAEDLVQETMLLALRGWHRFEAGSVRAWLMTILRHRFINEYRRAQHRSEAKEGLTAEVPELDQIGGDADPEGEFFARIVDERVQAAIEALPPEYRTAVVLSDLEGLSYAEIAELLQVPVGTVRSRIFRGRRHAQAELYRYAVEMGYVRAPAPAFAEGARCPADRALLLDYLKQELTTEVATQIREHLQVCCDCQACVQFERSYRAMLTTALERQRCPESTRLAILGLVRRDGAR